VFAVWRSDEEQSVGNYYIDDDKILWPREWLNRRDNDVLYILYLHYSQMSIML